MRQDYVKLIKEYVKAKPDYKEMLDQIKVNVMLAGATQEEFDEALSQMATVTGETQPSQNQDKKTEGKNVSFSKKLLELDIATHIAVIVVILFAGAVLFLWYFLNNNFKSTNSAVSSNQKVPSKTVVPQVYANAQKIDAEKVFSFPPSKVTLAITGTPKKEVFGFFPYWILDKEDKVSLNALTSLALFGLEVDGKGNIITTYPNGEIDGGWNMWNDPKLDDFIKRAKRRRIKIELTLKAFDNGNIESLVQGDKAQKTFISNAVQLLQTKSLDGINLDFEYVGTPDKKVTSGFTRLVTNLNSELKRQLPNSSLTIDTYVNSAAVPKLFDLDSLEENIDAFIVMGYDIHTPLGSPGPIAPMEGEVSIIGYMQSYLEKLPPEKLILAVPYYGYDWPVPNVNQEGAHVIPYAEIAATSKSAKIQWNDTTQTPWYTYVDSATRTSREVHFENPRSLGVKYDYVNRKNLRGIGIWALGYDGLNADLRQVILEKFAY